MAAPSLRVIFTQSAWSDLEEIAAYWTERDEPERGGQYAQDLPAEAIRQLSEPGIARAVDWAAYDRYRERLAGFVPRVRDLGLRRIWAATIDYTPDHMPIIGPAITPEGRLLAGVTVAAAAGHGMMWGPGISRAATDLIVRGTTDVLDVTDLGLDRFDAAGRSRLATDPVTLPYPVGED